jgi:hypothetical protein
MLVRTSGTRRTSGGAAGSRRVALAAGVLIAMAACAPRYVGYGPPLAPENYKKGGGPNPDDPYTFTITLGADGCPSAAPMEPAWRKCPDQAEDCARVKGGQSVQVQSKDNQFVLQFDPFGQTTINAGGKPVVFPTQRNTKVAKPYTFIIRGTGACGDKVVDPQIILD